MNTQVKEFIDYIVSQKQISNKETLIQSCQKKFQLIQDRKVFHSEFFAARFCWSKNGSFSNTVLALSVLEKYDKIPFFVVLVCGNKDNQILLANTTFLKKISHSSKELAMDNIKGSFNGSNIMRNIDGLANIPKHFDKLFAIHEGMEWEDNLQRLVDASTDIKPTLSKFTPTDENRTSLLQAPSRAQNFIDSDNFSILLNELREKCESVKDAILTASHIENVNIRGRIIEALITTSKEQRTNILNNLANMENRLPIYDTKNGLGDYNRTFGDVDTYTDIKTKIIYLNSNPKAYNIDKFLKCMSEERSVFMFFFIGINEEGITNTILCSVFHDKLLDATRLQDHWAGRSTRGVAQFTGEKINNLLQQNDFTNSINVEKSQRFLNDLLSR
jgi:hypothetical protein